MTESDSEVRWNTYVQHRGAAFDLFWQKHLSGEARSVLFVMGRGFDPRTTVALRSIVKARSTSRIDVLALAFQEGTASPSQAHKDAADSNWEEIQALGRSGGNVESHDLHFRSEDGRRVGSRHAANVFSDEAQLHGYTDVVVDISAVPRGIFFPLIARLLYFHDSLRTAGKPRPNVHVVVAEDPSLDFNISEEGIDETASYLHPFEGDFNREATGQLPKVWVPVLGERRTTQFLRIYDLVKPDEICPVLPSPSRSPRRGDDIVMEYQELLFDELSIDPRNIIYASEYNPFDVYRQIRLATLHYQEVLQLIGGCKVAISALGSKLMSLGVLLVAYELKDKKLLNVGVGHIECQGYLVPANTASDSELVGLWLAGECYETVAIKQPDED